MVNLFFHITKRDVGIKEKHKMRLAMGHLVLFLLWSVVAAFFC